jgi:hypothetical protein
MKGFNGYFVYAIRKIQELFFTKDLLLKVVQHRATVLTYIVIARLAEIKFSIARLGLPHQLHSSPTAFDTDSRAEQIVIWNLPFVSLNTRGLR